MELVERDDLLFTIFADVLLDVVQADALNVLDVDLMRGQVQLGGCTGIGVALVSGLQLLK